MKKLISLLIILIPLFGFGQTFEKFTQFGGTGDNRIFKSVIDNQNNIYLVGYFSGKVIADMEYTAYGSGLDIYVAKYDSNGNLLWFKQIGSENQDDIVDAVTLSQDGSSVLVGGGFYGSIIDFGNGFNLTNTETGTADAFLASLNTSDGSINSAKSIAYGIGSQRPQSIKFDKNSNLVVIGYVHGNSNVTSFDATTAITCLGPQNYFILQMDPSLNVNWVKHITGNDGTNKLYSLDVDNNGYYIVGTNKNTLDLDVKSLASEASSADMFLYKTDFNGNGEWVRSIKGSANDYSVYATCDQQGHIFISGYYASTDLKVDSTATLQSKRSVPNKGGNDIFFAKYKTNGDLVWFDVMGSAGDDRLTRLSNYGRYLVMAGQYSGTMTIGNKTITPKAGTDALGLLLNKEYNFVSPLSIGGSGTDVNQTCVIGNNGKFYFIGQTNSPITYFTTDSMVNATPATRDVYIARYGLELTNNEPEVVVENAYRFKSTVTVDSLLTADSIATKKLRVDTLKFNDGTSMSTASTGSTITASDGVYMDGTTVKLKYTEDHDSSLIWNFKENSFIPNATDGNFYGGIELAKYYVQLSTIRRHYPNLPFAQVTVVNDDNKIVNITQSTRGYEGNIITLQIDTTGAHYLEGNEPDTTLTTPLHLMTEAQTKREIAAAREWISNGEAINYNYGGRTVVNIGNAGSISVYDEITNYESILTGNEVIVGDAFLYRDGSMRLKVIDCSLTDGSPTQAELSNCAGSASMAGQIKLIKDNTTSETYQIIATGTNWTYIKYTTP